EVERRTVGRYLDAIDEDAHRPAGHPVEVVLDFGTEATALANAHAHGPVEQFVGLYIPYGGFFGFHYGHGETLRLDFPLFGGSRYGRFVELGHIACLRGDVYPLAGPVDDHLLVYRLYFQ